MKQCRQDPHSYKTVESMEAGKRGLGWGMGGGTQKEKTAQEGEGKSNISEQCFGTLHT